MPLNLQEVPTEALVDELARRYPHCIVVGCNDVFAQMSNETTDLMFVNGSILSCLGLLRMAEITLRDGWMEGAHLPEDTP